MLLPVQSIPPTAEHNATLHRTDSSRGRRKPVRLTEAWKSGMGFGGPSVLHMVLSFLIVSAVIWYLFVLLTALAANSLRAYCAVLSISPHYPFRSALPRGPELAVGRPTATQYNNRQANCRKFLLNCEQRFSSTRTVHYNQATRCHIPEYCNVPTPCLLHGRLT